MGLDGPDDGSEPEIPLEELHGIAEDAGEDGKEFAKLLLEWVKKNQPGAKGRTVLQIAKAYDTSGSAETQDEAQRLLRPVVREQSLIDELVGYIGLIRRDLRGLPYVVPAGGLVVVETRSRATSGTHYTPRFLAEEVVLHALEPLVYSPGPLQTADTSEWLPVSSSQILELKVADIAVGSGAFLVAAARYLGRKLLEAWDREGITGEDDTGDRRKRQEIEARREIIAHCLYGADINSMAVEMCKLSLWLVSLDPLRPFSFVDDKIFCGNSLLGLTEVRQLRGLHIDPSHHRLTNPGFAVDVDALLEHSTQLRHQLASTVSENDAMRSIRGKQALLEQIADNNSQLRDIADGIVACGLEVGGKPGRPLEQAYESLSLALINAFPDRAVGVRQPLDGITDRGLTPTVRTDWERWKPLHWIIEVPDVMLQRGGFDAVIGNPPFLGGKKISGALGVGVRSWLVNQLAHGATGNADLVAYFFLRADRLLRVGHGQIGLIATNTIAQGDTREVGLDRLVSAGLTIRRSVKSAPWPAASANLEYAAVWGSLTPLGPRSQRIADDIAVAAISTMLEPQGATIGPAIRLNENQRFAYVGAYVLGKGFLLKENEARLLLARNPRNQDVVFPYLNGEDLNSRPDSSASRLVVNFFDWSESKARGYGEIWNLVEERVKPERRRMNPDGSFVLRKPLPDKWWQYADKRPGLYAAIAELDHVIAIALVSKAVVPMRVPTGQVFSHALGVFATDDFSDLTVLSSSLHQLWAITYGSTLETRVRYTPSDVFETFPMPRPSAVLRALGKELDQVRREVMLRQGLGLTALYNLVNDRMGRHNREISALRDLHISIDREVARAYGWDDLQLIHGFFVYRQAERFTVDSSCRAQLLDRLLQENHHRAAIQDKIAIVESLDTPHDTVELM